MCWYSSYKPSSYVGDLIMLRICTQAAAKRFRVTGGGVVVRRMHGKQHLNERKNRVRLNRLSKMVSL
jgi:ribosomal protein L35